VDLLTVVDRGCLLVVDPEVVGDCLLVVDNGRLLVVGVPLLEAVLCELLDLF
jgi:hypothetical protein